VQSEKFSSVFAKEKYPIKKEQLKIRTEMIVRLYFPTLQKKNGVPKIGSSKSDHQAETPFNFT
jgi:hypothetical protein